MAKEEIFTTVELPVSGKCDILEGKGRHFFKAYVMARGDSFLMVKYLIMELSIVNGKKLSESDLDEMPIRDINYLSEVISTMMNNDLLDGL